jgi:MFS transporter, AAHS family, 4-hydroxybenzoate transporter
MSASYSVDITELIDRCPLGALQIRIIVLCGLVAVFDGFDILAIGVSAPAMAGALHITPNLFGFLFIDGYMPLGALALCAALFTSLIRTRPESYLLHHAKH